MKKFVTIGGGTGQYLLLKGLKNYDIDLTAIVNVVDNGGSSGELRVDFGILPPGDIRNCLIALADETKSKCLAELFAYRFSSPNGKLDNHNLGNLIITALSDMNKDMGEATIAAGKLLGIHGKVLPVSIDNTHLFAKTFSGKIVKGEANISYISGGEKIEKLWLEPKAFIYSKTSQAIKEADIIIICPGEIYGSIMPNFLVDGVKEAIEQSDAKIVYVSNLVTKQGSYGFRLSDFVNKIELALGKKLDKIICNKKKPDQKVVDKYFAEESCFVEPDLNGENIIKSDLLQEIDSGGKIVARHDFHKTARLIMGLLKD